MEVERFTGGLKVPVTGLVMFKVGAPFGSLTITDSQLTLAVRLVSRLVRGGMKVNLSDIAVAYPARRRVLPSGIGIDLVDGRVLYFWTRRSGQVLDALGRRRVPADSVPRTVPLLLRTWRRRHRR